MIGLGIGVSKRAERIKFTFVQMITAIFGSMVVSRVLLGTIHRRRRRRFLFFLEKGYHFVELHHENLTPLRDVQNAQEFVAYIGGVQITELKNIDAPANLLSSTDASELLGNYAVANYHTIPADQNEKVWELFGEEYVKNASAAGWNNTCATRLSIALNRSGYRLSGAEGANNVQIGGGDISILNPDGETGSAAGKHICGVFLARLIILRKKSIARRKKEMSSFMLGRVIRECVLGWIQPLDILSAEVFGCCSEKRFLIDCE